MSRSILAAGLVLLSAPLAQAGDSATFSPNLIDPPVAISAPSLSAHGIVAQPADCMARPDHRHEAAK